MDLETLAKTHANYDDTLRTIEEIFLKERSYTFEIPHGEDVLVLLSGGLDSVAMSHMVAKEWQCRIFPLYIKRGARAEKYEEQAFDWYNAYFKDKLGKQWQKQTKLEIEIPPLELKKNIPDDRRKTVGLPLRNSTIQNYAVMTAISLNEKHDANIRTVFSGSVAEDGRCPELSILSLRAQNLSTCIQLGEWQWQISSPMLEPALRDYPLDKRHLILWAKEHKLPLEKTRTCFSNQERACGKCQACKKRAKAFAAAQKPDPASIDPSEY